MLNGLSLTAAIGYVYQDENASALDDDDALEFELTLVPVDASPVAALS